MTGTSSFSRKLLLTSAIAMGLVTMVQAAEAGGRAHGARPNAAGGVTAAGGAAHQGPNGGKAARGRVVATDGNGNAATVSGGAFKTPSGAKGARAGATTVNADGTVNHESGGAVTGPNGSASSQGGFTRNADGTVSGGRSSNATGPNGNSAQSTSTYDSTNGYSRTTTCSDAAGNTIACPSR